MLVRLLRRIEKLEKRMEAQRVRRSASVTVTETPRGTMLHAKGGTTTNQQAAAPAAGGRARWG